jgi:hypothetical protein
VRKSCRISERARLYRLQAEFGARTLPAQPSAEQVQSFERDGGQLREKIQAQELTLKDKELKEKRRQTPAKMALVRTTARDRTLCPTQNREEALHRHHQTHCLSCRERPGGRNPRRARPRRRRPRTPTTALCHPRQSNLRPDLVAQTLTVELHRLGSPLQDRAVAPLCQFLTASETLFPTTNLRLIFRQIGSS